MKAFLCKEFGPVDSHKVEEIEDPVAGPGQVVVDIKATGISFPDVLIVQGLYQFKPPFPFSPGSEISGIVSSVGEGVTLHKEGDRVMGSIGSGGLCERGAYSEHQLMPLPESMDFNTAAGFPLNYGTTYHAFKQRGELKEGQSVLVLGAGGGLGITAIHIAKAMGAKVIAAASSQEKMVKKIEVAPNASIIAVIGSGMKGTVGVASKVFTAAQKRNVNVMMIAQGSSELNLAFVVKDSDCKSVVQSLHEEFQLDKIN